MCHVSDFHKWYCVLQGVWNHWKGVCVCVCVCWYCVTRFSLWYQCIDNTNVNINIRTLPVQHFDNFPIVHHYHHSHCNFEICLAKVAVISTFKSFNYNCRKLPHLCSFFLRIIFTWYINQLRVKALKFYRDRPCCTSPLSYHFVFIVIILYYTFTVLE